MRQFREIQPREPETPNLSAETAETILDVSMKDLPRLSRFEAPYHELVGIEFESSEWRSGEQQTALEGMGVFLANTLGRYSDHKHPMDWSQKRQQLHLIEQFQTKTYQGVDGKEYMVRDYMRYQEGLDIQLQNINNNYKGLRERYENCDRSDFVFFGVPGKTSEEFDRPVRIYYRTNNAERPAAVWYVMDKASDQTGRYPYGKFFYTAWSDVKEQRSDGVLLMAYSQEELTAILNGVVDAESRLTHVFPEDNRMVLGEPIEGGLVRLAQEPNQTKGIKESFNETRERILRDALQNVLGRNSLPSAETQKNAIEYIQANKSAFAHKLQRNIKELSKQKGLHPDNFNFNAEQDLDVIWQAVADSDLS